MSEPPRDPWFRFQEITEARIAIGRVGSSLPTREVLAFALAHAQARDAVRAGLELPELRRVIEALGLTVIAVESEAVDRQVYLRRPDLGRRLSPKSRVELSRIVPKSCDLAIMLGDGLSATAINAHAVSVLAAFMPHVRRLGLTIAPVILATGARVALGDEVGTALGARLAVVLIGERPGLSAADSLGIYLTYAPRPDRQDADRKLHFRHPARWIGSGSRSGKARLAH